MIRKRIAKQKIQQFDMKLSELNVNITLIIAWNPHFKPILYIILTATKNLFLSDMDKLCFKLMRTNNYMEIFD